jgi:hypothetical protein
MFLRLNNDLSLNSVKHVIFVMVQCARAEFFNIFFELCASKDQMVIKSCGSELANFINNKKKTNI